MICDKKHLPDMPDNEFRCPKCQAKCGDWAVDDAHEDGECERMIASDNLVCYKCGHGESAGTFVRRWLKSKRMIVCPHCKGTGRVGVEE